MQEQNIKALKKSIYLPIMVFAVIFLIALLKTHQSGMSLAVGLFAVSYLWGYQVMAKGLIFSGALGFVEYFLTGEFIMALVIFGVWLTIGAFIGFFIGGYHFVQNIVTYRNLIGRNE